MLLKGKSLCHGTSGNGYSFIALSNATGEQLWLDRAHVFGEVMGFDPLYENVVSAFDDPQRINVGVADHPYSLMEGLAGTICFFLDCLNPLESLFPTYEI